MNFFFTLLMSLALISCSYSNNSDKTFKDSDSDAPSDFVIELSNLQDGDLFVAVETELDFGTTTGSARTLNKEVSVKNNSSLPMPISFSVGGSNGFSIKLNRCPLTIPPGSLCKLTVQFSSRSLFDGIAADNLIVNAVSGGNNLQVSVPLKATVSEQPNNQTLSPSLSFSISASSPTSQLRTLNVSNAGPGDANNLVVSAPAGYVIWTNRCPSTLKSNKKCSVTFLYKSHRTSAPVDGAITITATGGPLNEAIPPFSISIITGQDYSTPVEFPPGLRLTKDLSTQSSTYVRFIGGKNGKILSVNTNNKKFIISDGTESGTKELANTIPDYTANQLFPANPTAIRTVADFDPANSNPLPIRVIGMAGSDFYFVHYFENVVSLWKSDLSNSVTLVGVIPASVINHSTVHNNNIIMVGQRLSDNQTGFFTVQGNAITELYPSINISNANNVRVLSLKNGLAILLGAYAHPGLVGGFYKVSSNGTALIPIMGTNVDTNQQVHLTIQNEFNSGYEFGADRNEYVTTESTIVQDGVLYMLDSLSTPNGTDYNNHIIVCDGQTGRIRPISSSFGQVSQLSRQPMVDDQGFIYVAMWAGDTGLYALDSQLSSFSKVVNDPGGYGIQMFRSGPNIISLHYDSVIGNPVLNFISNGSALTVAGYFLDYNAYLVIGNRALFRDRLIFNGIQFSFDVINDMPSLNDIPNDIYDVLKNNDPNISVFRASSNTFFLNFTNPNNTSVGREIYILKFPY